MEWIPWAISGVGVASVIVVAVVRSNRNTHNGMHKRIDHTRKECKDTYASKDAFEYFREETNKNFRTLNSKVDGIPQAVKTLLNGGGK